MKLIKKIPVYFLAIFIFLSFSVFVFADTNDDKLKELTSKIEEYEKKIKELQGQQQTLKSTISFLNNKISLTQAQVSKTEKEIEILEEEIGKLSIKIGLLDRTLDDISEILSSRIAATYKSSHIKPAYLLFSTGDFSSFLSKIKYLKVAQAHDHLLMMQMEKQKKNYDEQKDVKKEKQVEMEELKQTLKVQTAALAQQQQSKQVLLQATKNDEDKFQSLLAKAREEQAAITAAINQAIKSLKNGTHIEKGTAIGLMGNTGYSTGPHLHFEITDKNGNRLNPASILKPRDVIWDLCGWYGCDGEFSFTGSWDWPMNGAIRITQGYGMTAYAKAGAYKDSEGNLHPHTGIDIVSDDITIRAPKSGTLYKGMVDAAGANYVAVEHDDVFSWYWHLQ